MSLPLTLDELVAVVSEEVAEHRAYAKTPRGWHVMWGADGEIRSRNLDKVKVLCADYTEATGFETAILTIGAQGVVQRFRPIKESTC